MVLGRVFKSPANLVFKSPALIKYLFLPVDLEFLKVPPKLGRGKDHAEDEVAASCLSEKLWRRMADKR